MLAEKKERLRSSSFFLGRHVWSACGQQLQESFVFCLKCELELAANVAQESCDVESQKNIIETYLLAGFDYDTIDSFLERLVVSKTKHSKTKTEAPKSRKRDTQNSKTEHPKLENEAPKSRNHCRLKDYNFKSCMTQAKPGGGNGCVRTSKGPPIHPTEHLISRLQR